MKLVSILALCSLLFVTGCNPSTPQVNNDYNELSQLVLWERQARVRHLYDDLAQTYWPDATVTTSWISSSAADFAKAGAAQNRRAEASAHEVIINRSSAPIIHQHGNRAYVELPTESNHWITVNGEPAIWTSYMRLIYRCEKRGGVWKIADMTSVFESDKLTPVFPGTDLQIQPQDLAGFRQSYRWMAYTRTQAGGTVSPDLLGIDRPEDIATLYAHNEAWIRGEK